MVPRSEQVSDNVLPSILNKKKENRKKETLLF
jgi:hypothetical protein